MYRLIIVLTFGLHTITYGQNLTGQVYQLANSYLESECTVYPECDCCASDLIFLTEKKFALIARCIFNDGYYTGTYQIKDKQLSLTFKQTVVNEIINDETNEVKNEIKNITINPVKFNISNCGQNKIGLEYADTDGKDFQNGSRRTQTDEERIINELKETTAWKLLLE